MAGLCAFLFPGLGHLIAGKPFQALLWCVGIFCGYIMLIVPGFVLHIISIVHAVHVDQKQQAEMMADAVRASQQQRPEMWKLPQNPKQRR